MSEVFRIIYPLGVIYWYKIGTRECHREDGPAYINLESGHKEWCQNGLLHREDGPAYISFIGDYKSWYQNGERHREDGPAIESLDNGKKWYYKGKRIFLPRSRRV